MNISRRSAVLVGGALLLGCLAGYGPAAAQSQTADGHRRPTAIGVGTFVPNNAVIIHEEAVKLLSRVMQERGIKHTTSECTLRGFTCSSANVDPKTATPAEIAKARKIQTGNQVDGITGGLAVKDQDPGQK